MEVMQSVFSVPVRVYIEDTDAGGIVYYVNYLKFMERARTEFLRALGYDKPAILTTGQLLVVHSASVNYRRPARLDDSLSVTAVPVKIARSSVIFLQQVFRERELLCEANIRIACVDASSMKPSALPEDIHAKISALVAPQ